MAVATNFPVIPMDFPDPDIIRVGNTYYMVTTTMHFNPGAEILRSYDLVHWEHANFVFDTIDEITNDAQQLIGSENIYGSGMWAASLRFHNGQFYVVFSANDTHRSYLFTAEQIEGPWTRRSIQGFYHDNSLFFDDDGKVYLIYGNTEIHLTELLPDCSQPKAGGLNRVILADNPSQVRLGFEGSHFYKINGKYYLFVIHWPNGQHGRRTEACYMSDSLTGPFHGRDVFNDDMNFNNSGVAQGGIVGDTQGHWYAMLFQDHGAHGRMPVLVPVHFDDQQFPVFGVEGKVPRQFTTVDNEPAYEYKPLISSDDFAWKPDKHGVIRPENQWEWNHIPEMDSWRTENSGTHNRPQLIFQTHSLADNILQARNTLTARTVYPYCEASVTVDLQNLRNGDHAGLVSLLSGYAAIEVTKRNSQLFLRMVRRLEVDPTLNPMPEEIHEEVLEKRMVDNPHNQVCLKIIFDSRSGRDLSHYYVLDSSSETWLKFGEQELFWKLDHFTGCRIGLFYYSTLCIGGECSFSNFTFSTE